MSPDQKAPKGRLEIELEDFPLTQWAGLPAGYKKFQVMMCKGKKVIVDHYYIGKGLYLVSEMIDRPGVGIMPTYLVSPDKLTPVEEVKH